MENIVENLRGKKLSIIGLLIVAQFVCILIGGLFAPQPYENQVILDTICEDDHGNSDVLNSNKWYYSRGNGSCENIDSLTDYYYYNQKNQNLHVVHTFQMPIPTNGVVLDYSRWQQNLAGALQIDSIKQNQWQITSRPSIILDIKLAYRNKDDPDDAWRHYASAKEEKFMDCSIDKYEIGIYNCEIIPLFEFSGLYHDYYLLNIRFLYGTERNIAQELKHRTNLSLIVTHQNGDFTKILLALKTVFFHIVLAFLIWYWRRVRSLSRSPVAFEYMLLSLGLVLSFFNMPLEYLTIYFDIPYMLLINEIRQFILYFVLMSFLIVFIVEHSIIQYDDIQNNSKCYWERLSSIFIGCLSVFFFGIHEHAVQLKYPFYFFWIQNIDNYFTFIFIGIIGLFFGLLFLSVLTIIWIIFKKIKYDVLPSMNSDEQLQYDEILYRFKIITSASLLCAFLTMAFVFCQIVNNVWKWDHNSKLAITSEYFTGICGLWNIFTIVLLYLYAPLGKKTIQQQSEKERIYTIYSPS